MTSGLHSEADIVTTGQHAPHTSKLGIGEPEPCCSSSHDVLAGAAIHAKTKLDDCLQRSSTAYLIGGAYWMPPLLQSEFSPRGIFSFDSAPTLRS